MFLQSQLQKNLVRRFIKTTILLSTLINTAVVRCACASRRLVLFRVSPLRPWQQQATGDAIIVWISCRSSKWCKENFGSVNLKLPRLDTRKKQWNFQPWIFSLFLDFGFFCLLEALFTLFSLFHVYNSGLYPSTNWPPFTGGWNSILD